MRYDIFLASAMADRDRVDLLVRRLRGLKLKVRYARTRSHTTPTAKDVKQANLAETVLVVWSRAACDTTQADSDWVHAMAHQARSRPGALLQAGLDKSVPDEPFDTDHRYSLIGMGPKRLPRGLLEMVDELGTRTKRPGLRDWLALAPRDTQGKSAWMAAHPEDPIAMAGRPAPAISQAPAAPVAITARQAAPVTAAISPPARTSADLPAPRGDHVLMGLILLGISALFVASYLSRSSTEPIGVSNAGPQFIFECPNGERMMCPIGTLEPTGPVIDDTSD